MRLTRCSITNFCSFSHLELDFSNLGLTLISGRTGAGKSTIMDAPCWILFGTTSKDLAADEVKPWGNNVTEPTSGELVVELGDSTITVTRIRGRSTQNDLYWVESSTPDRQERGKDLTETQKRLEARLGVTAELYMIASYYHQFSKADAFFNAKAKDRREILEKISDLSLPVSIAEGASATRKLAKASHEAAVTAYVRTQGKLEQLNESGVHAERRIADWDEEHAEKLALLDKKRQTFEQEKNDKIGTILSRMEELDRIIKEPSEFQDRRTQLERQINQLVALKLERNQLFPEYSRASNQLSELQRELTRHTSADSSEQTCPYCLGNTANPNRERFVAGVRRQLADKAPAFAELETRFQRLEKALECWDAVHSCVSKIREEELNNNRYIDKFDADKALLLGLQGSHNTYDEQLTAHRAKANPHRAELKQLDEQVTQLADTVLKLGQDVQDCEKQIADLTLIYDLSFALRGVLLRKALGEIEASTNRYLNEYFDAELKVAFSLEDSDQITLEIQKNGNVCSNFRQLSGGQRKLLTLAFSVSLMKAAANKSGVQFSMLCFDEPFGGKLDSDDLIHKAFKLFQELETEVETVIVIDHCEEFKNLFTNQFHVTMNGDESSVSCGQEQ